MYDMILNLELHQLLAANVAEKVERVSGGTLITSFLGAPSLQYLQHW